MNDNPETDMFPGDQEPFGDGVDEFDPECREIFARAYLNEGLKPSPLWKRMEAAGLIDPVRPARMPS